MKTLEDSIQYLLRIGLLSLDIVATPEIIDPEIKEDVTDWEQQRLDRRPACVCCEHEFSVDEALPALFAILRTTKAFPRVDDVTVVSGICQSCAGMPRDKLQAAAIRAYGDDATHIKWHHGPGMPQ